MVIGSSKVLESELRKLRCYDDFVLKAKSLIPEPYRENRQIIDNQVYYLCLLYNRLIFSDNKRKRELLNNVLGKVFIKGYLDEVIELKEGQ